MKHVITALILVAAGALPLQSAAQEKVLQPTPSKELVVETCSTQYNRPIEVRCRTREFLEQRGSDFVFLIREKDGSQSGELVLNHDLSTKIRPIPYATYAPHSHFLKFPLETGSQWGGTYDQEGSGRAQNRTRSARVVAYEEIQLKVGKYKAFKIVSSNKWNDPSVRRAADEQYWYCPELAAVCRYESPDFDIREEVVSVTKRPPQAAGATGARPATETPVQ